VARRGLDFDDAQVGLREAVYGAGEVLPYLNSVRMY